MAIRAIFEDTRQQLGKHTNISDCMQQHGIELIRQQLYVGDYTLIKDQSICVDTKKDLSELCTDLGTDKSRFMREVARAKRHGIHLIVLIEESEQFRTIPDVSKWDNPILNPRNKRYNPKALTGKMLVKRMINVHTNYGTDFLFCTKAETGARIVELLEKKGGE